jgi:hypothetical protein
MPAIPPIKRDARLDAPDGMREERGIVHMCRIISRRVNVSLNYRINVNYERVLGSRGTPEMEDPLIILSPRATKTTKANRIAEGAHQAIVSCDCVTMMSR